MISRPIKKSCGEIPQLSWGVKYAPLVWLFHLFIFCVFIRSSNYFTYLEANYFYVFYLFCVIRSCSMFLISDNLLTSDNQANVLIIPCFYWQKGWFLCTWMLPVLCWIPVDSFSFHRVWLVLDCIINQLLNQVGFQWILCNRKYN